MIFKHLSYESRIRSADHPWRYFRYNSCFDCFPHGPIELDNCVAVGLPAIIIMLFFCLSTGAFIAIARYGRATPMPPSVIGRGGENRRHAERLVWLLNRDYYRLVWLLNRDYYFSVTEASFKK
uniref:Uncharacterized protein n=1 Tax=Kalanchoe fedtschenkoi TaxID=63787 RepID=A0A7N0UIQ1_KALFE